MREWTWPRKPRSEKKELLVGEVMVFFNQVTWHSFLPKKVFFFPFLTDECTSSVVLHSTPFGTSTKARYSSFNFCTESVGRSAVLYSNVFYGTVFWMGRKAAVVDVIRPPGEKTIFNDSTDSGANLTEQVKLSPYKLESFFTSSSSSFRPRVFFFRGRLGQRSQTFLLISL